MIFDTHCHLNSDELYENIEEIIKRAKNVGVDFIMVPSYDYESNLKVFELIKREGIYGAIGLQPEEIDKPDSLKIFDLFARIKAFPKIKAIGEIGLDFYWEKDPAKQEKQKEIFIKQISIANELGLPIIVHSRDALNETYQILKKHKPIYGGIMHCYSGPKEMLKDFIDLGMLISLGGPTTFKNAKTPKEVAKAIDLDKLLVETDAPYLAPHPLRGTRNEPANICLTIKEIASIKEISEEDIIKHTYENACRIFKI